MTKDSTLIPIRLYAKLKNKSRQEIYRLIRENRIEAQVIEKVVKRIVVELTPEEIEEAKTKGLIK